MKTKHLIITIAGLMILFSSCVRRERIILTKIDKQMIPYKLGDIIRFESSTGDTMLLTVESDYIYWHISETDNVRIGKEVRSVTLNFKDFYISVWCGDETEGNKGIVNVTASNFSFFSASYDRKTGRLIEDVKSPTIYDSFQIGGHTYYDVSVVDPDFSSTGDEQKLYYNKTYGILQLSSSDKKTYTLVP